MTKLHQLLLKPFYMVEILFNSALTQLQNYFIGGKLTAFQWLFFLNF